MASSGLITTTTFGDVVRSVVPNRNGHLKDAISGIASMDSSSFDGPPGTARPLYKLGHSLVQTSASAPAAEMFGRLDSTDVSHLEPPCYLRSSTVGWPAP